MPKGEYQYKADIGFLTPGNYYVILKRSDKEIASKFVKQ
jgi:hypothetical protein